MSHHVLFKRQNDTAFTVFDTDSYDVVYKCFDTPKGLAAIGMSTGGLARTSHKKTNAWQPTDRTVVHKGKTRKVWSRQVGSSAALVHAVKLLVKGKGKGTYRYERV